MKKLVYLLLIIVFAFTNCKNKKPAGFTTIGDYSPYWVIFEKLNGKVEKVTEKYYWTIPDGDTFKKGKAITRDERAGIAPSDFETTYYNSGDVKITNWVDENNKVLSKWELFKENEILTSARYTKNDTLRRYQKLKCNSNGDIIEASLIESGVDTLIYYFTEKTSMKGDTVTRQYFDKSGIPINNYENSGIPIHKRMAVPDEYGQFLYVAWYDKDGVYTGGLENKFNEKGNYVGSVYYDKEKNVLRNYSFSDPEYDDHGNWIKHIYKGEKGTIYIERTYTYYE